MIKEYTEALVARFQTEIDNYSGDMANGQPQSFDEYQRLVGLIQGLRLAMEHATDLAKMDDDDDA